ncbi:MAG: DUF2147 domain-containing protein [Silicimonas sp.]|nr:DUF2147 domain-containing protein [Silicimonas sp.]
MKPIKTTILAISAAAALAAPAWAADPVVGLYKTQPGDDGIYAHVQIYECGAAICGKINKAFNASGTPVKSDTVGKRMIWDMKAQGDGAYGKGKIWAPDRDKTYKSKMKLSGNSLKVSGCVLGICRSQNWKRVK